MNRPTRLHAARSASFLIVVWGLPGPAALFAGPTESAWNFVRVGTATLATGELDRGAYSKLGPWPRTDGEYL